MVRLVLENSDQLVSPLKPSEAAAVSMGTFTLNLPQESRTDANLSVNPPSSKPLIRPDLEIERNKYDENPAWVQKESVNDTPASLEYYTCNSQVFAPLLEDPEEAEGRLEQLEYTKVRSRERHDRSQESCFPIWLLAIFAVDLDDWQKTCWKKRGGLSSWRGSDCERFSRS